MVIRVSVKSSLASSRVHAFIYLLRDNPRRSIIRSLFSFDRFIHSFGFERKEGEEGGRDIGYKYHYRRNMKLHYNGKRVDRGVEFESQESRLVVENLFARIVLLWE